jgi:pSer/pThr/pTyr-binding forkhead associated (FHA) protein
LNLSPLIPKEPADSVQAFFRVLGGDLIGGVFHLSADPVVIGSSHEVALHLPDTLARDRHAGIRFQHGSWQIHDLCGEGIFINDIPTRQRVLSGGEILRIGKTELQFSLEDPRRAAVPRLSSEEISDDELRSDDDFRVLLELRIEKGDPEDQGRGISITHGPGFVIGRSKKADFSIHDHHASRMHCRIEALESDVLLVDLKSLNGTHLEGRQVTNAALRPGDLIVVGRTAIRCLKT